jgi:hypothetical protein
MQSLLLSSGQAAHFLNIIFSMQVSLSASREYRRCGSSIYNSSQLTLPHSSHPQIQALPRPCYICIVHELPSLNLFVESREGL